MKKFTILFFSFLIFFNNQFLFSQTKKIPVKKKEVTSTNKVAGNKRNTVVKTNVQKTKSPVAKSLKLPAKTKPTVTVKTKITPKKVVTITEPAKLPESVNTNENANVVLTSREQEMINEINNLRKDPKSYILYIENYLKRYGNNADIILAGKELIGQLKIMQPLNQLILNPVMYNAAKQFGSYLSKQNELEHSSLPYYENLSLGHKDVREAIVDLLIDDNNPDRGHRKNLLNDKVKQIAVFEVPGKINNFPYCFIQEFR